MDLTIGVENTPDEDAERAIYEGLDSYNRAVAPGAQDQPLCLIARDAEASPQAGLMGLTYFNWLFVKWLWVAEAYRGRRVGSRLLEEAEAIARARGMSHAYLDTFTFQAPAFYEKHGYREFGRLPATAEGHSRIWLTKRL
jgi:GNAT superfamily N-acetyltransferase